MIALSRLKNGVHIDFHKRTLDALRLKVKGMPILHKLLQTYEVAIKNESVIIGRTMRSDIVASMREVDMQRDNAYRHLRILVKSLEYKSGYQSNEKIDCIVKACKRTYTSKVTKYDRAKKFVRLNLFVQMLKENAELFHEHSDFKETVKVLEDSNKRHSALENRRIDEKSDFKPGLTDELRAETDHIYRVVISYLESLKNVNETIGLDADTEVDTALNIIDQNEKETRKSMKISATWRKKKRERENNPDMPFSAVSGQLSNDN